MHILQHTPKTFIAQNHAKNRAALHFTLSAGHSYQVADQAEAHRSSTRLGATLFIVD